MAQCYLGTGSWTGSIPPFHSTLRGQDECLAMSRNSILGSSNAAMIRICPLGKRLKLGWWASGRFSPLFMLLTLLPRPVFGFDTSMSSVLRPQVAISSSKRTSSGAFSLIRIKKLLGETQSDAPAFCKGAEFTSLGSLAGLHGQEGCHLTKSKALQNSSQDTVVGGGLEWQDGLLKPRAMVTGAG
ncbi:hypothetical protein CC1G_14857 [Coprinopsis cinerea okayama7|uniref:Uncharacterized protein n=1 Tax=Coprinopsis cinerea (strain Okayama-7 / 130 / ATCC MYA-4618 / FGSC 9003) TaxID=240176 RepID=D6RNW2_COPC7|nr:hypothetical protein CC1G_14857 [Coprinopsis cinerea okayama7\|eukprot:XP_002910880.1 hypothetical protein CC1G_14857 [Coprinopsis cinerea okayama7\